LLLENDQFITCSRDTTIRIWSFDKTITEKILTGHKDWINSIIMLRNGKLCSASTDRTIKIWNIEQAICEKTFSGYTGEVCALVELPNGVVVGGGVDQIRFWDLQATNKNCTKVLLNKGYCFAIILLNSEEMACSSGNDINIFKIHGDKAFKKLSGHSDIIWDLLSHGDGKLFLSSSHDFTMRMWNVQTGICIRVFKGNACNYRMVWWHEKTVVATMYHNGEIKFWNVENGECLKTLKSEQQKFKAGFGLAVGLDGGLMSYGEGPKISFWSSE